MPEPAVTLDCSLSSVWAVPVERAVMALTAATPVPVDVAVSCSAMVGAAVMAE